MTSRSTRKSAKPAAKNPAPKTAAPDDASSSKRFKRDLLVRGDAAVPDAEGNLPAEATHEIVEGTKEEDGLPKVKRRLFKLF